MRLGAPRRAVPARYAFRGSFWFMSWLLFNFSVFQDVWELCEAWSACLVAACLIVPECSQLLELFVGRGLCVRLLGGRALRHVGGRGSSGCDGCCMLSVSEVRELG
jgi:hypothetical protein